MFVALESGKVGFKESTLSMQKIIIKYVYAKQETFWSRAQFDSFGIWLRTIFQLAKSLF